MRNMSACAVSRLALLATINDCVVARTKLSRGSEKYKTLGDDLVRKMAQQLHISMPMFRELESCTKSRDDYLQLLKENGFL